MIPKFRAWDVHEKKMFTNDQLIIWNGNVYANDNSKLNVDNLKGWNIDEKYLMQSTGLKDKNGKEIYEGDIVRYECCFGSYVEEVIYDDKHCNFGTIDNDEETFSFAALISHSDVDCFEVVGNKYENPELLERE